MRVSAPRAEYRRRYPSRYPTCMNAVDLVAPAHHSGLRHVAAQHHARSFSDCATSIARAINPVGGHGGQAHESAGKPMLARVPLSPERSGDSYRPGGQPAAAIPRRLSSGKLALVRVSDRCQPMANPRRLSPEYPVRGTSTRELAARWRDVAPRHRSTSSSSIRRLGDGSTAGRHPGCSQVKPSSCRSRDRAAGDLPISSGVPPSK